ncbi:uncharacterized protein LOC123917101 isoform X2 [Trifolium pratense]|uniref:uncharacterized protein LOC123917101 isoform X2 n=1 Tax=Trifolium pratense TaxID=57577 RepID=UPI001E691E3D|nr:uncharacterized protein LOC123917101 isoform X2 [Trifolium pratense]
MDSKDKVNMPELDDWYKAMLERYKDPKSIEMINSFVKVLKEIAAESNKMYSKDKVNEPELDDWYKAFIERFDDRRSTEMINSFVKMLKEIAGADAESNKVDQIDKVYLAMDSKDKVNMPELDDWYKAMVEHYNDTKSIEMINSFVKVLKEIAIDHLNAFCIIIMLYHCLIPIIQFRHIDLIFGIHCQINLTPKYEIAKLNTIKNFYS